MYNIKQYIESKLESGKAGYEIAKLLGVSNGQVSSYKNGTGIASLTVAKTVYKIDQVVLHPFSEESLKFEIAKDK
jgi:predicted transcriptional regulator